MPWIRRPTVWLTIASIARHDGDGLAAILSWPRTTPRRPGALSRPKTEVGLDRGFRPEAAWRDFLDGLMDAKTFRSASDAFTGGVRCSLAAHETGRIAPLAHGSRACPLFDSISVRPGSLPDTLQIAPRPREPIAGASHLQAAFGS